MEYTNVFNRVRSVQRTSIVDLRSILRKIHSCHQLQPISNLLLMTHSMYTLTKRWCITTLLVKTSIDGRQIRGPLKPMYGTGGEKSSVFLVGGWKVKCIKSTSTKVKDRSSYSFTWVQIGYTLFSVNNWFPLNVVGLTRHPSL